MKLDDDGIDVSDLLAKTLKKGISFDQQAEGSAQVERGCSDCDSLLECGSVYSQPRSLPWQSAEISPGSSD